MKRMIVIKRARARRVRIKMAGGPALIRMVRILAAREKVKKRRSA